MKLVGELDAGNRHVQFDERGRETECWPSAPSYRARPRLYPKQTCRSALAMSAFEGTADIVPLTDGISALGCRNLISPAKRQTKWGLTS
jgi:hypothetical protein